MSQLIKTIDWYKPVKKTVYTLNIGDYAPEICALTYPLIKGFARKINAEFHLINERKFPEWPIVYEKLQIHTLGREHGNDWNIFIDSDVLINPDMFDVTEHLQKNTVCHNGQDMAGIRWRYDQYFRRDGRHIGSCNWFTVASDWCLDLWRPLDDLTLEQATANINITVNERNSGFCSTEHLIDDYTLSRNIARYGLRVQTVTDLCGLMGWKTPQGRPMSPFFYHKYAIANEQKAREMVAILTTPYGQMGPFGMGWGLMNAAALAEYRERFDPDAKAGRRQLSNHNEFQDAAPPGAHIQGWMGDRELRWLNEVAGSMSSVVEVGCWKGRSTFALCSSGCPRVIAVDHFKGSEEQQREFGFLHGWSPFPEFQKNVLDVFQNVELKMMSSADAAAEFQKESIEMVFIDGAHDTTSVLNDLMNWDPKALRIVAIHDRSCESVRRALDQHFRRAPDEVVGEIAVFRT